MFFSFGNNRPRDTELCFDKSVLFGVFLWLRLNFFIFPALRLVLFCGSASGVSTGSDRRRRDSPQGRDHVRSDTVVVTGGVNKLPCVTRRPAHPATEQHENRSTCLCTSRVLMCTVDISENDHRRVSASAASFAVWHLKLFLLQSKKLSFQSIWGGGGIEVDSFS